MEQKYKDSTEKVFSNVHEILHDSAFQFEDSRTKDPRKKTVQSFQVAIDDKMLLDEVCRSNSSTASAFLRGCVEALVEDYR